MALIGISWDATTVRGGANEEASMSLIKVMLDQVKVALRDDGTLSQPELLATCQKMVDRAGGRFTEEISSLNLNAFRA